MHRQRMSFARRDFQARQHRRIVERRARLTHAAAVSDDKFAVLNDLGLLKTLFLAAGAYRNVKGKLLLRPHRRAVYPRRRQRDICAPALVVRIEIGRKRRNLLRSCLRGALRFLRIYRAGGKSDGRKVKAPVPSLSGLCLQRRRYVPFQFFPIAENARTLLLIPEAFRGKPYFRIERALFVIGAYVFCLRFRAAEKITHLTFVFAVLFGGK